MSRLPAAQRREQLLQVAADLFARHGYARATTAELARAAGVTEPIIYRHFKSKKDLFIALIERTGQQTLEQWESEIAKIEDPAERLTRLVGDNPMVSAGGKSAYRVFLQAITEVDDEQIRHALVDHIEAVRQFLQRELTRAQNDHKVTTRFSAEVMAKLLIHLGLGYGVESAMAVPNHGQDAHGIHVQHLIGRLLVGRQAPMPDASGEPKRPDSAEPANPA